MYMSTKKINNFIVKPLLKEVSNKHVRGGDLLPICYSNTVVWGGTGTGKSNCIFRLMEQVAHRCTVLIFSSTMNNDPTYKKMVKMLKDKKKCIVQTYDHFIDSETGLNRLDELRSQLEEKHAEEEDKEEEKAEVYISPVNFGDPPPKPKPKKKKDVVSKLRPLTPEIICIYDDLSCAMQHTSVYNMLNKSRHYNMKNIIAIHSLTDLKPPSWQNVHYILCFGNLPEDKLKDLQIKAGLGYKKDTKDHSVLWDCYKKSVEKKYNMLFVDRNGGTLRKNFNEQFVIE